MIFFLLYISIKRKYLQDKVPLTCSVKFYKFRNKYLQNGAIKINEIFSKY